jgi:hypothetical protein
VQLGHQGDAAQHWPAQAQQHPVAAGGDALDVEAVVLAGNGQERPQQRFAGQGGGEGILAVVVLQRSRWPLRGKPRASRWRQPST